MTPEQFYKLDEMKQSEIVWEGTHIGQRQDEDYIIMLYKKDNLYVEVFLHKKDHVIKKFQAFSHLDF